MRHIIRWMFACAGGLCLAGGLTAYWVWSQSDELLRQEILKAIHAWNPEARVQIGRARFAWSGRVHLLKFALSLPNDAKPCFAAAEIVVTLDRELLRTRQQILVDRVRLLKPVLRVERFVDGTFNVAALASKQAKDRPLPDIEIDQGACWIRWHDEPAAKPLDVSIRQASFQFSPQSQRRGAIQGRAVVENYGDVEVARAEANLDGSGWSVAARWTNLPVDSNLRTTIERLAPTLQSPLANLDRRLRDALRAATSPAVSAAPAESSHPSEQGDAIASSALISPLDGVRGFVDLELTAAEPPVEAESRTPAGAATIRLREGSFAAAEWPFPLSSIAVEATLDARAVHVKRLSFQQRDAQFEGKGWLRFADGAGDWTASVRDVVVDAPMRQRLPGPLRKLCEELALVGRFDGEGRATRMDEGQPWSTQWTLTGRECSAAHVRFPYPLKQASGTITGRDGLMTLSATGRTSSPVPVQVTGEFVPFGPNQRADLQIIARQGVVDRTLLDACNPGLRKTLVALDAQGSADVVVSLHRPRGYGQKFQVETNLSILKGSIQYAGFPLKVTDLTGQIRHAGDRCLITNVRGRHEGGVIVGNGEFTTSQPGRLDLSLAATGMEFNRSLYAALPAKVRSAWDAVQPRGEFDVDVQIGWDCDRASIVEVRRLQASNAEVQLREFPYRFSNVAGRFSFIDDVLSIESLEGWHDETHLRVTRGSGRFPPDNGWSLRFDEMYVDDLVAGPALRRALAGELRLVVESLDPEGKISIAGGLEFEQPPRPKAPLRSRWNLRLTFPDGALTAGTRFEHLQGQVKLQGEWDGERPEIDGEFDFKSAFVLNHQLVDFRGPIAISGRRIVGGSAESLAPAAPDGLARRPPGEARMSAKFIGGRLLADVVAVASNPPRYDLQIDLVNGRLEQYAAQYLRGQNNLKGAMNGWVRLHGESWDLRDLAGMGNLLIADAAMYELPILVQTLKVLQFDGGNRTAFERAEFNFRVDDERFLFDSIDLVGSTVSLRGRGMVRFDGLIQLDFFSMLARNQVRIPVVHELVGMLSRGWVGVEVRGNIGNPQARVVPVPELDDALRQFLGAFEPRPVRPQAPTPTFRLPRAARAEPAPK